MKSVKDFPQSLHPCFSTIFFIFTISSLMSGCGKLPGFTVDAKIDNFVQTPVLNDKIDILFVVDNSGSMGEEQTNLANSFEGFITKFTAKNLNYQVGVISTDVVANTAWWAATTPYQNSSPYKFFPNNGPGSLLAKTGNDKIIRPTTVNPIQQFSDNVLLGITGSGSEAGILSALKAFDPDMLSETGWNYGFVRDEALLAIVFVSDEDESRGLSPGTSTFIRTLGAQKDERVNAFVSRLDALKPDRRDLLHVEAIVAPSVAECPTVAFSGGVAGTGDVYMEVAAIFGGNTTNLCQDFSDELEDLGSDLVTVLSRFKLIQKPLGQIEVKVDGVVIPRDASNGWEYLAETQEVEFRGSAIPSANAEISVRYVPGAPLQ